MNIEKVKAAYSGSKAVKAICDEMASRDRNQNETKLNRILQLLWTKGGDDIKKSEVIAGFRTLEEAGCGQYVEGRHGWPSRFVWEVKSLDVAAAAKGQRTLEPQAPEQPGSDLEMIEHSFVLRPELTISIELPDDLTRAEGARLAAFLQAIPFGE
jgi:hypothetical protein